MSSRSRRKDSFACANGGDSMRERTVWMITIMVLVWSTLWIVALNATRSHAQNSVALHLVQKAVPASAAQRDSDDGANLTRHVASSADRMEVSLNSPAQQAAAGMPIRKQLPVLQHIKSVAGRRRESPPEGSASL